ncbi:MAG: hypothetical protein Q8R82_04100 [Hyphomonadaceae bacterium]|nr:hypothetical protein [Hyphomonadaceae bacterium]
MAKEDEAAQVAADALEQALLRATRSVEAELARVLKRGEDDLDRLASRIGETLARLAIEEVIGAGSSPAEPSLLSDRGGNDASFNQVATALMRAARRGGRFV